MQKLLLVIVILLPLGVCAQSTAKPAVDSRSAFEIILAKVKGAEAQILKDYMSPPKPNATLVRRAQSVNDIVNNIKTRRSLIAFLLEPPDLAPFDESLRLQWVLILQNEQIADALEKKPAPRLTSRGVILQ